MTVSENLAVPGSSELDFQRLINAFVDDFRAATPARRAAMIADGPTRPGKREGLVAAVVSALCARPVRCRRRGSARRTVPNRTSHSPPGLRSAPAAHARIATAFPRPQRLRPRKLSGPRVGGGRVAYCRACCPVQPAHTIRRAWRGHCGRTDCCAAGGQTPPGYRSTGRRPPAHRAIARGNPGSDRRTAVRMR